MADVEGIISIHDLHVWSLSAERIALSAHVVIGSFENWPQTLSQLQLLLAQRFGIEHVTLQPEIAPEAAAPVPASNKEIRS